MTNLLTDDQREQRKAAMALNYCAMSISTILEYKDRIVLDQEYNAIINDINMQEIVKDEALIELFKSLLRTLTYMKMQEGDKDWVKREYDNNIKNAIFNSMSQFNVVLAGANPWSMVIGALHQVGVTYMNYRRNINQYREGRDRALWEIEKDAIKYLNELRISWFEASLRLADRYKFPDEWRLTQPQIDRYLDVLKDPNLQNSLERLNEIADWFEAYPPYWYYRASRALYLADEFLQEGDNVTAQKQLEAARMDHEHFDHVWMPILRNDQFRVMVSLDKIRMLNPASDAEQIRTQLAHLVKHARHDYESQQFAAIHYLSIQDIPAAESRLRALISEGQNLPLNGKLLSRIYSEQKRLSDYKALRDRIGTGNVIDLDGSLFEARAEQQLEAASKVLARAFAHAVTLNSRKAITYLQESPDASLAFKLRYVRHSEHVNWIEDGTRVAINTFVELPIIVAYAALGEESAARVRMCEETLKSTVRAMTEPFLREVAEAEAAGAVIAGKKASFIGAGAATVGLGIPGLAVYGIYKFFSKINAECNFDSECNDTPKALDALTESIASSAMPIIRDLFVAMARLYERKGDSASISKLLAFIQAKACEDVSDNGTEPMQNSREATKDKVFEGEMEGQVKWFNEKGGFGFIKGDDGKKIFVHYTEIQMDGSKNLKECQRVRFEIEETSKGPKAKNVWII